MSVFLDEEEVTEQVSSLKKSSTQASREQLNEGLGLERASFKWNSVPEPVEEAKKNAPRKASRSSTSVDDASTAVETSTIQTTSELDDHVFELRNISVRFPEGQLTVITGPTASGKTALLVSPCLRYSRSTAGLTLFCRWLFWEK